MLALAQCASSPWRFPMNRRREPPSDLKEACARAARDFIAEHGVERLSLRDVARRLGVSHQAPYRHFPSRDHLLAEVMRRCFRDFASFLDDRVRRKNPSNDLASLGSRYLIYASTHPVEYRLMFGTPWPETATEVGLVADARHAFDVLRTVLERMHGKTKSAREKVDLDAMFIWSNMHGLASITQSQVMSHLGFAPGLEKRFVPHVMSMMRAAMQASGKGA